MNRCLNHLEALQKMTTLPSEIKRTALGYCWRVYMDLQEFNTPERHDYNEKRELPLTWVHSQIKLLEESEAPKARSGEFSGGTGYRSVNWDAEYWMAETKYSKTRNEYWNEEEAKNKRPVKVYTKEELEKFQ